MLDQDSVVRIIEHMNDDHADALLLYVKAFGGESAAVAASLESFDEKGMGIRYRMADGGESACRIEFKSPLTDAREARKILVEMVERARSQLGEN